MKYFLTLFGVALFVVFVFAFKGAETFVDRTVEGIEAFENGKPFGKREKGNREVVDEERELAAFTSISSSSGIDVELIKGDTQKVVVRADSNLQERLKTEVEDGKLKLYAKGSNSFTEMKVFVTFTELEGIKASGASDVVGKSTIEAKDFYVSASGASEVQLELVAEKIKVTESGASTVSLSGNCEHLEVKVSGASDAKLYKLSAKDVKALASGASDVEVTAITTLGATASGASDINYKGNPKMIKKKESGASSVTKR